MSFLVYYWPTASLLPARCQFTTGSLPTIGGQAAINWRAQSRCFGTIRHSCRPKQFSSSSHEG
ncbi:MAG: hypothetical protein IJQ49_03620 [Prevotella sp.]|nr:hypothetical protein [Prevotella sp.]